MRTLILSLASAFLFGFAYGQSPLDSKDLEQTLTPEEFSDVIKVVWDEISGDLDTLNTEMHSKSEFETTAAFNARVDKQRSITNAKIRAFVASKGLAERRFAVLLKAAFGRYNADTRTYTLTSPSQVLVPTKREDLGLSVPQNSFVTLTERDKRGYKFAYVVLGAKPEYLWHIDPEAAQKAKVQEQQIFFKVWFRVDVGQTAERTPAQLSIIPTRIALVNQHDKTSYWSEEIAR